MDNHLNPTADPLPPRPMDPQQQTSLKIAAINVNSLVSHQRRNYLSHFAKSHHLDAVLISETKLNSRHKSVFSEYTLYRTDRPNAIQGGGTAIFVRNTISHTVITHPSPAVNTIIEYTIIKLKMAEDKHLYIISLYASQRSRIRQNFTNDLNQIFSELRLDRSKNFFIVAGDINASTPTYTPAQTYLDHCIIDSWLNITNLLNNRLDTTIYESDHKALLINIQLDQSSALHPETPPQPRHIFEATNWTEFTSHLGHNYNSKVPSNRNLDQNEIDNFLLPINNSITHAIDNKVPKATTTSNTQKHITQRIKQLDKKKSSLLTFLHRLRAKDPRGRNADTKTAKLLLAHTREDLNIEFSAAIEKHWSNTFKKINHRDSSKFMPSINRIFRPKTNSGPADIHIPGANISILHNSGNPLDSSPLCNDKYVFTDPTSKLNAIGAFYESINSPRHLNDGTRLKEIIDAQISLFKRSREEHKANNSCITTFNSTNRANNPKTDSLESYFTTPAEIEAIIKKLPNKTSSGIDKIPTVIIRHLPLNIIKDFTTLINNALNINYFPKIRKVAQVMPILKKEKPSEDPSSYRPISLTSNHSKVYEIVINNLITRHCNQNKIIPDDQFGFRRHHSTTHAVHKFLADVNKALYLKCMVDATLIDIKKASDSVWLDGLIYITQPHQEKISHQPD
ncbi:uncharacterized protein [Fopius arisanus]|uniref:Reverse transcriptase domain-containing protein n=1 Tax=Fopius arisanus TaxID=64838 RepID=A0A9R1U8Z2_9HYME|nr:PREDICTED: uncharacterized protein LOC105272890 [Fopius arisanus]